MSDGCVLIAKQLVMEQIAQQTTMIQAQTSAIMIHTTALLVITILAASGALIAALTLMWKRRKNES